MMVHPLEKILHENNLTWGDLTSKFLFSPATVRSVRAGFVERPHKLVQRLVRARIIQDEESFMREYGQWREEKLSRAGA